MVLKRLKSNQIQTCNVIIRYKRRIKAEIRTRTAEKVDIKSNINIEFAPLAIHRYNAFHCNLQSVAMCRSKNNNMQIHGTSIFSSMAFFRPPWNNASKLHIYYGDYHNGNPSTHSDDKVGIMATLVFRCYHMMWSQCHVGRWQKPLS